jgi:hypothetical protein
MHYDALGYFMTEHVNGFDQFGDHLIEIRYFTGEQRFESILYTCTC